MKKSILFFLATCLSVYAQAITGPKLVGSMPSDGANSSGTIIQYTGGDTVVSSIYNFPVSSLGGNGPAYTNLTQAPSGLLYGLNPTAGPNGMGSIFEYNYNTNTATVKVYMDSAQIGYNPNSSLLLASNGIMYGLNQNDDSLFGGTLFSYIPGDTTLTTLVILPVSANPSGALIQASNGKLYGLTNGDGTNASGTIFQYDIASNTYTVAYNLPNGAFPNGRLLEVGADTLYGLTNDDGTNNSGTLFRYVISSNMYTALYSLNVDAFPSSWLIVAKDGNLYGLTNSDGANSDGTLFSYNIGTATYTDVYDFGATATDGIFPDGGVMQASDGNLYGQTNSGGTIGNGTIFRYNIATSTYTSETSLSTTTGDFPGGGSLTEYRSTPPVTVSSPAAITACIGSTALFTASATGALSEQWQVSTNGGTSFSNIVGAVDTSYSFTATALQNGTEYRIIFTNASGSDTTVAASLIVTIMNDTASVSDAVCTVTGNGATYQWYPCSTGVAISGATSQTYTATQNGSYYCVVTLGNCTDTTQCVTVTDAGINEISGYNFSLYPDPTSGVVTITNDQSGTVGIKIVNMLGESLKEFTMTSTQGQFDISDLESGIYQVQIRDNKQTLKVLRIVKE